MIVKSSLLFLYLSSMFKVEIIESGYIMADGGAMFGAIPKRAWQRKYPNNNENLCPLAMRCILVVSDNRKILVDTGMGNKHLEKVSYYRPYDLIDMREAVQALGYSHTEITDVVLTHLHFDHCGGATHKNREGEITPSFPNANYWVSKKQWDNLVSPNPLEADSLFKDNIESIDKKGQLRLVEKDCLLTEGFEMRLFDGHSQGQLVPYILTKAGTLTFPGDLIPTAAHVSLDWISAYDIDALTSYKEKERFLIEAEQEGYSMIFCHDIVNKEGKVKRLGNNYKIDFIEK